MKRRIPGDVRGYLIAVALAVLVLSVYWRVRDCGFINLDDNQYVTENPVVLQGLTSAGVIWAFTENYFTYWHPLTWLSHMAAVDLFGLDPGGHHIVNLVLHLLNVLLLFLVLNDLTRSPWRSGLVAALFAIHPIHVEPVAWIAARTDVLSTLFFLLAVWAYARYVKSPGLGRYLAVATFFAMGLTVKPMLVTLPFVLLLLDWWPLGRMTQLSARALFRLAREKAPLFLLSGISCAVTYLTQARGSPLLSIEDIPLELRIANAPVSYVAYLGKTVWPSSLAVFYPHPATIRAGLSAWEIAGSVLLLCGISAMALWQGRRRPYLAVGWSWYLGTLIPVIGLVQAGSQAYADRYTYVPLIGVFIAVAWGMAEVLPAWRFRRLALWASAGVALAAFAAIAWVQTGYWRDSVTLFSRTLAVTEENWFAWNNLGASYAELGQPQKAIDCLRESLRIRPVYAEGWFNLGVVHAGLGQDRQAISYFRNALRIKPDYAKAWNNLGMSYDNLGQYEQAIGSYAEALRIEPGHARVWNNLGVTYLALDQYRQAIVYFREALRIEPEFADARHNLSLANGRLGLDSPPPPVRANSPGNGRSHGH